MPPGVGGSRPVGAPALAAKCACNPRLRSYPPGRAALFSSLRMLYFRSPAPKSSDGSLDVCKHGWCDRKSAQANAQQRGDATRVTGHIAAQADGYVVRIGVFDHLAHDPKYGRLERILQG